METLLFSLFLFLCCSTSPDSPRLVVIDTYKDDLKSMNQIKKHVEQVSTYFSGGYSESLVDYNNSIFLMYFLDKELVAFTKVVKRHAYIQPRIMPNFKFNWLDYHYYNLFCRKTSVYHFFSVSVLEKYRKKKFATKLITETVNYLKNNDKSSFYLALHLSPDDRHMEISAKMYYMLGFRNFTWTKTSAFEFTDNIDNFTRNSVDFYDLCKNPLAVSTDGFYICSIVHHSKFSPRNGTYTSSLPRDWLELGRKLKLEGKKRKEDKKHSF